MGARLLFDHVMQDWRDLLPIIDVPTLVIAGEVSHVAPESQVWTKDPIAGAQFRLFTEDEGGAHFPFFENPYPSRKNSSRRMVTSSRIFASPLFDCAPESEVVFRQGATPIHWSRVRAPPAPPPHRVAG